MDHVISECHVGGKGTEIEFSDGDPRLRTILKGSEGVAWLCVTRTLIMRSHTLVSGEWLGLQ